MRLHRFCQTFLMHNWGFARKVNHLFYIILNWHFPGSESNCMWASIWTSSFWEQTSTRTSWPHTSSGLVNFFYMNCVPICTFLLFRERLILETTLACGEQAKFFHFFWAWKFFSKNYIGLNDDNLFSKSPFLLWIRTQSWRICFQPPFTVALCFKLRSYWAGLVHNCWNYLQVVKCWR